MRVARRRMVRAVRAFIAFVTCARETVDEAMTDAKVHAMMDDIAGWKRSTGKMRQLVRQMRALRAAIAGEVETTWGKLTHRTRGTFLRESLPRLCEFKEREAQIAAFGLVQTLALHDDCATALATKEMFKLCVATIKGKDKERAVAASGALTTLVNHDDTRFLASDEGLDKSMTALITEKGLGVRVKRNCVVTFARIADDPEVASLMSAKAPEQLIKNFLDFVDKTDDTDTEKWALIAIARLAMNDEFSNLMEKKGYVPFLFELSRDKIPARKLAAALVIAHMARNKDLRETLVKYRAIQLFCTIAMNTSERIDMAEMQLVAALAIAELALYEPNGERFCKQGALKWIIQLARTGDVRSETAAITALSNLMLSPGNQSIMIVEDGTKVVDYLQNSRNPRVAHLAKQLLKRLRMAKLRAACKFAARMKATGNALIDAGIEIGEGYE